MPKAAVIGLSGGLDSALALLVAVRAYDRAGPAPASDILAVTMPCFGTTRRTQKQLPSRLAKAMGVSFHAGGYLRCGRLGTLRDIGHDRQKLDVTYENASGAGAHPGADGFGQPTRRALVIGTGDLSELALGWATYNGDHMSMYGVNASVPKTLVRHIVAYEAASCTATKTCAALWRIFWKRR